MHKPSKGFTIIELIVVIAIIAVLAAIVLVNVASYSVKSKNVAVKENMHTLSVSSVVYFEQNPNNHGSDFTTISLASTSALAIKNADNGNILPVESGSTTTQAWCACAPLFTTTADPSGSNFCIDSKGVKKEQATNLCTFPASGSTECSTTASSCL
jgi:prepilin-type N-terminal cleavage/methylation domain-containing protein